MVNIQDRSQEQLMRKQLLLLAVVVLSFVWLLFQLDTSVPDLLLPSGRIIDIQFEGQSAFLVNTDKCRIPNMDPFDDVIRPFITEEPDPPKCDMYPFGRLVKADLDSIFIDYEVLHKVSNNLSVDPSQVKCYYQEFWRKEYPMREDGIYPPSVDTNISFSPQKNEIRNRTHIVNEEFIKVTCKANNEELYKDYFAFPRAKEGRRKENNTVSVLLIGIDSVSRLNLIRQMPRTVTFFKEKVTSIEMMGYNKVGDNTFPNMVVTLSGQTEDEMKKSCWQNENVFDDCPFIWKKYKEANFTTGYYEDAAWMGLFNYQKSGFWKQPTDYYGQVYSLAAERELGNDKRLNAHICLGDRLTLDVLLENAKRYAIAMKDVLSWSMFWSSSLTHDYLNLPRFGDVSVTNFLHDLHANGIFDSTIVVFMSDHGIRWGGIRSTYQGYMEERLPFLYIAYPEWFGNTFQLATRNLRTNRRRLTTHFDLYETLVDLTDLNNLKDSVIRERTKLLPSSGRRGTSLFLPVLQSRTCIDAGISENWCTCYTSTPVATTHPLVLNSAETIVNHMNSLLRDHRECSPLALDKVLSARVEEVKSSEEEKESAANKKVDYILSIVTSPGNGVFEATVRYDRSTEDFTVVNTVSRLNLYGDQSRCISHYLLKLYCYCL